MRKTNLCEVDGTDHGTAQHLFGVDLDAARDVVHVEAQLVAAIQGQAQLFGEIGIATTTAKHACLTTKHAPSSREGKGLT